jgi:hypothetical protein
MITCPTENGVAADWSVTLPIGTSTSVALWGFIDADGSPTTPEDAAEGAAGGNPFDVVDGGTYTDLVIVLP